MQCGAKRSTCVDCHAVSATDPWHRDHSFADLCAACHGGQADAKEAAEAHRDLVAPRTTCPTCHASPIDYARPPATTPVPASASSSAPALSHRPAIERHGRLVPNLVAVLIAVTLGAAIIRARRHR